MHEVLAWMKANGELSGWAQTLGALLALLVALVVPWLQHAAQARRERLAELELHIYLATATMLLLRDAQNLSSKVQQLADLPKTELNDPVLIVDLLERLRTLDAKDTNVARQTSQYVARAAVLRINHYLDSGDTLTRQLTPQVIEILKRDSAQMGDEHAKLNFLLEELLYKQTWMQVHIMKRPWVWWSFKTKAGRKWLEAASMDQATKLKAEMLGKAGS
ncbi:hypothetical protein [Roseateles noduli]|uniref:hypothetical protein n=1 Tax=Roseateles noduli TaxID=2052484 RepID=UPI003D65676D